MTKVLAGHVADSGQRASTFAYDKLCTAIVTLAIPPGALLNERVLAQQLAVARPTMAQALHRLSETGLVSILPRRGVLVAPVDVLDVQQVFDARLSLEGALAALAAERATPAQFRQLRALQDHVDNLAGSARSPFAFLDLDHSLHLAIAAVGRNRFLSEALARVWKVNSRLWHVFFQQCGTQAEYFLSHADILDALERRDAEMSRDAVRRHLSASKDLLQTGLWGRLAP